MNVFALQNTSSRLPGARPGYGVGLSLDDPRDGTTGRRPAR